MPAVPAAFILHGDADMLVPLQQSESYIAKLKETGVPCELAIKKGASHGWLGLDRDIPRFADWFDRYLAKKGAGAASSESNGR
jgi:dipeptidyl aminopeptidase/acylaminoacyl peptidase